jgi:predicted MFS family arabinose efflux permease
MPPTGSSPRRSVLIVLVTFAMAAGTFAPPAFGVLSGDLLAEFDIARWQIGALVTASALTGALLAPRLGRLTDRMGGRRALLTTLGASALGLAAVAASPTYVLLVLAACTTGIGQGISNPATNKLISLHVPAGQRGYVVGIKQSGVQAGIFLGGLLLPAAAALLGWRGALAAAAAVPAMVMVVASLSLPPDAPPATPGTTTGVDERVPGEMRFIALYGFLLGLAAGSMTTYAPLFAQESLGFSAAAGGAVVAVMGGVGVVARVAWGRLSERGGRYLSSLAALGTVAALAGAAMIGAELLAPSLVWVGAVATGAGINAWNAVGMLAVISIAPLAAAGRASGVVQFGFLGGLGAGAPLFGLSVDLTGTYLPGWTVLTGLCATAALLAWGRARRAATKPASRV